MILCRAFGISSLFLSPCSFNLSNMNFSQMTPRGIVAELDKHIIGQSAAKRAVAVALRNRWRREQLSSEERAEITPKNILMIGPTGVGKTEIARRLAQLAGAPLLKIEATKFTEIGYVGRDVDSIARELVEVAIRMVEREKLEDAKPRAQTAARERLLDLLAPTPQNHTPQTNPLVGTPFASNFPGLFPSSAPTETERIQREQNERLREKMAQKLDAGDLENAEVEIEVEEKRGGNTMFFAPGLEEMGAEMQSALGPLMGHNRKKRRVKVSEARTILEAQEGDKLLDSDAVASEAIERAQSRGIVFLDEIDKIAGSDLTGAGVSREGVQRDLLPLVEGATVNTKYGPVKTDHVLFIAAGAFHVSKPSDLIPELQGRFPVRVELEPLLESDLRRILTEPSNALLHQYAALLKTDGVEIVWETDGIAEVARLAAQVNAEGENIGARRLHTLLENVLNDIAFEAPDAGETKIVVDARYVRARLAHLVSDDDLSRLML